MKMLNKIFIHRYTITSFFACILTLCGLICFLVKFSFFTKFKSFYGTLLFITWFTTVGWFDFSQKISKEPNYPTLNNSQWQLLSDAIDYGKSPLCVPVNPWWKNNSWMYVKNCNLLKPRPDWKVGSFMVQDKLSYKIPVPNDLLDKKLISAAVLVKPINSEMIPLKVEMHIELKDGNLVQLTGSKNIAESGGLLMLTMKKPIAINKFKSITLIFNQPIVTALAPQDPQEYPGIVWMGN
jgi:hypothetical protein